MREHCMRLAATQHRRPSCVPDRWCACAHRVVQWPDNAAPGPLASAYNVGQDIVFVNRCAVLPPAATPA